MRRTFTQDTAPIFYWNDEAIPVKRINVPIRQQELYEAFILTDSSYYQVIFDSGAIRQIYICKQNSHMHMFGWCNRHIVYKEAYNHGGSEYILDEILPDSIVFRSLHAPHEVIDTVHYNRDEVMFLNDMISTPLHKQQNKHIWSIIQYMAYTAAKDKSTAK